MNILALLAMLPLTILIAVWFIWSWLPDERWILSFAKFQGRLWSIVVLFFLFIWGVNNL